MLSADIPLKKAVAGVRVGLLPEVGFVVNPTVQQMEDSTLDLIMAGTDSAVLMIEGYCDFLTEAQMLEVSYSILLIPGELRLSVRSGQSHCFVTVFGCHFAWTSTVLGLHWLYVSDRCSYEVLQRLECSL